MSLLIPTISVGILVSCNCCHKLPQTWWLAKSNTSVLSHRSVGFPGGSNGKESASSAGEVGSIPGSGRSSGGGNGCPLQCSFLENPMNRGAWWATVHGLQRVEHGWVTKYSHTLFHRSLVWSLKSVSLGQNQSQKGWSPSEGPRGESVPCLFHHLLPAGFPGLVATSFQTLPPSSHGLLFFRLFLTFLCFPFIWIHTVIVCSGCHTKYHRRVA